MYKSILTSIIALVIILLVTSAFASDPLFYSRLDYQVGTQPYSVASADFDGDGDKDAATTNYLSGSISLFYNLTNIFPFHVCGDADGSGAINILDATFIINYLYKGGPAPVPGEAGDANGSGTINILDVTALINYLYKGGPEPVCP